MKVVGSELEILMSHVIWRNLGKPCKTKAAVRTDYCWLMFRAGLSGPRRDANVAKSGKGQGLKVLRKNEVGLQ